MKFKELMTVLDAVKHLINPEDLVCINDSRDGAEHYPEARVFLIKDKRGKTKVVFEYDN